uniref:Uncharacterized protein n=1 Tax=Romanomermis culicivorax TaxID=13658 RepID=A0A915JAN5_ROMCU
MLGDGFKGQSVGPTDNGEAGMVIRSDSSWRLCGCESVGDCIEAFPWGGDGVLDQRQRGKLLRLGYGSWQHKGDRRQICKFIE